MTPEIERINDKMREDSISENHSGFTYGYTMRVMQYIARNGYQKYKEKYLRENSVETHQFIVTSPPTEEEKNITQPRWLL